MTTFTMSKFTMFFSIAAVVAIAPAGAVEVPRQFFTTATGICQSALPAFEGQIRKRPLGVQNEGTATAFVTCSFLSQNASSKRHTLSISSIDGVEHAVTCTGVAYDYFDLDTEFVVKSSVAPASGVGSLSWETNNFVYESYAFKSYFSVSCALPPGAAINAAASDFVDEIGA